MQNGIASGNAFLVETPALDRLHNQLYQEERQRDAERRQEMTSLDKLVSNEVGKMRSADTEEFLGQYEKYKTLKKQLLNPKTSPKNQLEYNKVNQQANIEYAKAMQMAQQSSELKDQFKTLASQRAKDPNSFDDNFLDMYSTAMNTPLSKLEAHPKYGNLADINTYAYKGGNTDFSKQFKAAEGSPRDLNETFVGADPNDKFKNLYKTYKGANNPYDYYNTLIQGVVGSQRTRDFPIQNKYTPDQEAAIESQFNKLISDPNYKKVYGITNQDFPVSAYNTEVGRTARLKSMEYAINNPPTEKQISRPNTEAITQDRQKFAKEQQARSAANSLARLYVYANIKDRTPENIGRNVDGLIGNMIEDARNHEGVVATDDETFKSITGHQKTPSLILKMDEAGNATYGKKVKDDKGVETFVEMGKVPLDATKIKLTKTYKSGLDSKYNTGNVKSNEKPATNKKVTDPALLKLLNQK